MSGLYNCSQCCRRGTHHIFRHARLHVQHQHQQHQQQQQQRRQSSHTFDTIVGDAPKSTRYSRPRPQPTGEPSEQLDDFAAYVTSATAASRSNPRQSRQPRSYRQDPTGTIKATEPVVFPGHRTPWIYKSALSELDGFIARGNASGAWSFFQAQYTSADCAALDPDRLPASDLIKHNKGEVYLRLLRLLTGQWLQQVQSLPVASDSPPPTLPNPGQVLSKFTQLGLTVRPLYNRTAWSLAVALQLAALKGHDIFAHPSTQLVLTTLLDLWPQCLWQQPAEPGSDHASRFSYLLSKQSDKLNDFAASVFLTHDLLRRLTLLPPGLERHHSLLASLDQVVARTNLNEAQLQSIEAKLILEVPPEVLDTDFKTDELLARLASPISAQSLQGLVEKEDKLVKGGLKAKPSPQSVGKEISLFIDRVAAASRNQNLDTLEKLWTEAQHVLHQDPPTSKNGPLQLRLYEQFLLAFFELRRPQAALQVWGDMRQSGHEPTVRTWNVMMKSCHISRSVDTMENMWYEMRDSGLQPDAISWSTRIYGLLRVGSVRMGLSALEEMGNEWNASQKPGRERPGVPKPDTAVLNAAIAALRGKRSHHIPWVLAWSRPFEIKPDVITYNALLNVSLAQGNAEDAAKILQRMSASNVEPDSSTFTVLITSMLKTSLLSEMTLEEQEQKIMSLIESFEKGGLKINVQGYALLIDRMLKEHRNVMAAHKVLGHMKARGIQPTPHIYTILMTHYFDSDPPQLYAADSLWNQIQSDGSLDIIFYDRMVEGFARHGDMGRTMTFLTRMSKEGKRPGWLAMISVVKCLCEKRDWVRFVQIVKDCHNLEGLLSVGLRGRKGQLEFWQYVDMIAAEELYGSQLGNELLEIVEAQREGLNWR